MILKVFVKDSCPQCPAAKELASLFEESTIFDLNTLEGLAESAFHSVLCTPSFILTDEEDMVINSWRCQIPRVHEISFYLEPVCPVIPSADNDLDNYQSADVLSHKSAEEVI